MDKNREHLRRWLLWVGKRKSAEDFEPIIAIWIKIIPIIMNLMIGHLKSDWDKRIGN